MRRQLRQRLSMIERRLNKPTQSTVIEVSGGLTSGIAPIATVGAHQCEAHPDESLETFRARVMRAAAAERTAFVVLGGLPDTESSDQEK